VFVSNITLKNFRNYTSLVLPLKNGITVLSGSNGQGKTNLLEAVYFCSIGKSPRTPRDGELILHNEEQAKISVECAKSIGKEKVDIVLSRLDNKRVNINGMPISKLGELMGAVATVFFSPTELRIVQGGPSERRSFIDIAICQLSKTYFYLLTRYQKILSQRNRLLKSGKATDDTLDIWDNQLASEGAKVIKTRKGFIKQLSPIANKNHNYLTSDVENLELFYEGIEGKTQNEIYDNFLVQLAKDRQRDIKNGHTHSGPQREDLRIVINGLDIRTFGSQGQQRTSALSLKLSELDLATVTRGESPILLLDDVLSELDKSRQEKLLTRVSNFQTLITCTHLEPSVAELLGSEISLLTVKNGTVS